MHNPALDGPARSGASSVSPQRAHTGPLARGNSVQQRSQMGTDERCGRGEPQRAQEAGKRAQLTASTGLRRTRATARQREVSEVGTSNVSEPESLRKTHLTGGVKRKNSPPADSIPGAEHEFHAFQPCLRRNGNLRGFLRKKTIPPPIKMPAMPRMGGIRTGWYSVSTT